MLARSLRCIVFFSFLTWPTSGLEGNCDTTSSSSSRRFRTPSSFLRHPAAAAAARRSGERLTLVGLFPIHERDCHRILTAKHFNGFQRAEAMVFALDKINAENDNNNNDLAIDGLILDTCGNSFTTAQTLLQEVLEDAASRSRVLGR